MIGEDKSDGYARVDRKVRPFTAGRHHEGVQPLSRTSSRNVSRPPTVYRMSVAVCIQGLRTSPASSQRFCDGSYRGEMSLLPALPLTRQFWIRARRRAQDICDHLTALMECAQDAGTNLELSARIGFGKHMLPPIAHLMGYRPFDLKRNVPSSAFVRAGEI